MIVTDKLRGGLAAKAGFVNSSGIIPSVADTALTLHQVEHTAREACCPRCGYDQRGAMSQWTQSCPLNGRCAECGLDFWWSELLQPEKYEPQWCVEFAPRGPVRFIKSCFKTAARTLWPWSFWKRQNMAFDVRWRRLALFVLFLVLLPVPIYVIQQTVIAIRVRNIVTASLQQWPQMMAGSVRRQQAWITQVKTMELESEEDSVLGITTEQDRQDALDAANAQLVKLQQQTSGTWTVDQPLWRAVCEAMFMPFSPISYGSIKSGSTVAMPYPAPNQLYLAVGPNALGTIRRNDFFTFVTVMAIGMFGLTLLMPIEFALLPISRKRAKVRWQHVWRVAVYSITPTACVAYLGMILFAAIVTFPQQLNALHTGLYLVAFVPPFLLVLWWAVAIKRYLRMPNGWLIAPVFAVLAILLTVFSVGVIGAAVFA